MLGSVGEPGDKRAAELEVELPSALVGGESARCAKRCSVKSAGAAIPNPDAIAASAAGVAESRGVLDEGSTGA